jgi:hypothetical protein
VALSVATLPRKAATAVPLISWTSFAIGASHPPGAARTATDALTGIDIISRRARRHQNHPVTSNQTLSTMPIGTVDWPGRTSGMISNMTK